MVASCGAKAAAIGAAYNKDVGAIAAAPKDRHALSLDHLRLGASNSGRDDLSARLCRRSRSNFLETAD
jgi:hypothetical protein